MANFQTHVAGAALISGTFSLSLLVADVLSAQQALIYFSIGVVGGLFPDIDSDNSWPLRIGFNVFSIVFSTFLVIYTVNRFNLSIVELLFIWILSYYFIRYAIFEAFTRITTHRGLLHTIPMTLLMGMAATNISYHFINIPPLHAYFIGIFLILGILTHLLLDELYAVDLLNKRLKKSFGTAMKFWADNTHWGSFATYIGLLLLTLRLPPAEDFINLLASKEIYRVIGESFLPF